MNARKMIEAKLIFQTQGFILVTAAAATAAGATSAA
jgi:hypothetical protein